MYLLIAKIEHLHQKFTYKMIRPNILLCTFLKNIKMLIEFSVPLKTEQFESIIKIPTLF